MEVKLSHKDAPVETEGINIELYGSKFLIKQCADGFRIIEVTDGSLMVRPETGNSLVVVIRGDERKNSKN